MRKRALLVVPVLLVAAACNTTVSDDRVVPGDTITVSTSTGGFPTGGNTSPCPGGSSVEIFVDGLLVADGITADELGFFEEDIIVPEDAAEGSYSVQAVCTPEMGDPVELNPAQVVVHAPLVLTATPTEVVAGGTFDVEGPWCISDEGAEAPHAVVTFEGEEEVVTAEESQPFGESWVWEGVVAPEEPGTYEVTATCSYTVAPDFFLPVDPCDIDPIFCEGPLGEVAPADHEEPADPFEVTEEYVAAEITVVEPTTTTAPTTSTTAPGATAPRAVVAAPSYTG